MFNTDIVNYAQRAHIRSWKDRCLYNARNYNILDFQHENAHIVGLFWQYEIGTAVNNTW